TSRTPAAKTGQESAGFVLRKLRSVLPDCDSVGREFLLLAMEGQLEPLGQQLLNHRLNLSVVRHARPVRFPGQVVLLRLHPRRRIRKLTHVNPISEYDQVSQARVRGGEQIPAASSYKNGLARGIRVARLDRRHFETWNSVPSH